MQVVHHTGQTFHKWLNLAFVSFHHKISGDTQFLILDPHYTGKEDIAIITKEGWCGWKGTNFWDKRAHYNMCMPPKFLIKLLKFKKNCINQFWGNGDKQSQVIPTSKLLNNLLTVNICLYVHTANVCTS